MDFLTIKITLKKVRGNNVHFSISKITSKKYMKMMSKFVEIWSFTYRHQINVGSTWCAYRKQTRLRSPISVQLPVQSFSLCNGDKGHYRKSANPFSIFRTSALALIKRVSYAITNFFGEKLMKRPSTEKEAKERGDELLETQVS